MLQQIDPSTRVHSDAMTPELFQVKRVRRELSDTYTMELVEPHSGRMRPFKPGQFNMLYAFGIGEVPISLSGKPNGSGGYIHTTRAVGPVTRALTSLKRGDWVGVRGPFGTAWPTSEMEGRDVVIVAGGIGLAPLRPAIYDIIQRREHFGQVAILYGARSPEEILYDKEIMRWRSRFDLHVEVTTDRAGEAWKGNVGVVTTLIPGLPFSLTNASALVCGPEIMMRFVARDLISNALPPEQIFVSMERNMQCGVGLCGHCQWGPHLVCRDGPVFRYDRIQSLLTTREL